MSRGDINAFHEWECDSYNLLFHAAETANRAAAQALLNSGADPARVNADGVNVLHLLAKGDRADLALLCIEAFGGDGDAVRRFVANTTDSGWSPLIELARHGRVALARLLLDHGADADQRTSSGMTALLLASFKGKEEEEEEEVVSLWVALSNTGGNGVQM